MNEIEKELIKKFIEYLRSSGFTNRQADFIIWVFNNYPIGENTNSRKEMLEKVAEYCTEENIRKYIADSLKINIPANVKIHVGNDSDITEIYQLREIVIS